MSWRPPARLDSKDEDELTILPVFENDSHLSQLVNFACEVYKAIQRIFLHYLRLTFNDFSNATFVTAWPSTFSATRWRTTPWRRSPS